MTERERALLQGKKTKPLTANESAIAYAVAHSGSEEPTYETVAEIQVGEMVEQEGVYAYQVPSESRPTFQSEDLKNLYIDGHKLERLDAETFVYNFDLQTRQPIATPAYVLIVDGAVETGYDLVGIGAYPDLSNTTVRILKKVEQGGGGELPENLKPTFSFGFTVTAGQSEGELVVTPDSGATYTAISAALAETPNIYANINFTPLGLTIRARFDIDVPGDSDNALTANAFVWGETKWMGARLSVVSDGTYGVELRET